MLSNLVVEIFRAEQALTFDDNAEVEEQRELLKYLKEYVILGEYTTVKNKDYLLRNFMKPVKEQAIDLSLAEVTIYKSRRLIMEDLERVVGNDIVVRLLRADLDYVRDVIYNATSHVGLTDVIITSVIERVNEKTDTSIRKSKDSYSLIDCVEEIKFLKKYTLYDLEIAMSKLDVNKLYYLIRLITYEQSDVSNRVDLLNFLKK